jgi:23S rRNA pseudouridine1911/1915/1917 synthase
MPEHPLDGPVREPSPAFDVLYRDTDCLVVNKPAGIFTQAPAGVPSLERLLVAQLGPSVGLPHRLDHGTSGTLLVALNKRSLRLFGEQFAARKVAKQYLAILVGDLSEQRQEWIDWLIKVPDRAMVSVVEPSHGGAKEAKLQIERLAGEPLRCLVRIQLITGRMHQIRVQAATRGHPILGDTLYGPAPSGPVAIPLGAAGDQPAAPNRERTAPLPSHSGAIWLHAHRLQFFHPRSGKAIDVTAPLPAAWEQQLPPDWMSLVKL